MPKLFRVLSSKEILRCFSDCGFYIKFQTGSHIKLAKVVDGAERVLIVPDHKSVDHGTMRAIYRQATLVISDAELLKVIDKYFKNKL